uniref:Helicase C-terminal domain-containing protein n=1 Tax=Cajanus cajan TaxID=3821 RepID=A0A151RPQ7_CAJCA|nr:hypothetical protein KK1_033937 [Cajanus cajan]
MSLQALKESLRRCSTQNPSSFSSSSSSSISQTLTDPNSILRDSDSLFPIPRKPPKSSLSHQLRRLYESPLQPHNPLTQTHSKTLQKPEEEEEEEEIKRKQFASPKLPHFQIDHTGPFEPLLLSSQGQLPVVQVPASINCRLLEHQREGVKFLYGLYKNNHGGILGDDMGLGKTIQAIAFLAAIFGKEGHSTLKENWEVKREPALIICPTSVIHNWESEFSKWSNFSVSIYHGANRDLIHDKLRANGVEILITSFDTYRIHGILHKYMLRRTKEETIGHLMMGKEDNIVFCAMSDVQKRVYRRMLQLPDIQCLINKNLPCSCGSPLTQVECCKRIVPDGVIWPYLHRDNPDGCDSCPFCLVLPCLVKLQQISNHLELIKPNPKDDPDKQSKDAEFAAAVFGPDIDLVGGNTQNESFMGLSDVKHCGKMRALEKLLFSWFSQGDKVLLFSYSVRMLDILEKFLIRKGYCFSRLDGSTPTNLRQSLVDDFNSSPSKQVFVISTRAGGLGLNLVSANRVVIFDPNWNPAQDLQAQDRSFRYGQKRHVVVFRLLAAGSLEELVYTRQVYKQQLSNIAVSGKMEKRYFEGVQDCKEFQGELFGISNLFRDLSDKLFTSEIIELHKEQWHETEQPEKVNLSEETGIVYAHRNEDIVNFGPGIQGKIDTSIPSNDTLVKPSISLDHQRKKRHKVPLIDERKRGQYRLLAQSMGMGELAFSKWLLSATPLEREKVLLDYKKKKKDT